MPASLRTFHLPLSLLVASATACTSDTSGTTAVDANPGDTPTADASPGSEAVDGAPSPDAVPGSETIDAATDGPPAPDASPGGTTLTYPIVDTGQHSCYGATNSSTSCPGANAAFTGQDAQYDGLAPSYSANQGVVTDHNTGLMWAAAFSYDIAWSSADAACDAVDSGGFNDWRVPSIRELYSLMDFSGVTGTSSASSTPYLDTDVFEFGYGDEFGGGRFIDAQYITNTSYVSTTMNNDPTFFGVNFADGRIKGYPKDRGFMGFHLRCVRGTTDYGVNDFTDNEDGTISDAATGLMWLRQDSGGLAAGDLDDGTLNWQQALAWCQDLSFAGNDDWRLPNAKELHSILDYSRSPDTTSSAAIDPLFSTTAITNEAGVTDYPHYWSSTTHLDGPGGGDKAVYFAFGEALGCMAFGGGECSVIDVHGAGAQRSDPKTGDRSDYPQYFGPQGDVLRVYNHARCVRDDLP